MDGTPTDPGYRLSSPGSHRRRPGFVQWTTNRSEGCRGLHYGGRRLMEVQLDDLEGRPRRDAPSFRSLEGYLHASDDAVRRVYDYRDAVARRRGPGTEEF